MEEGPNLQQREGKKKSFLSPFLGASLSDPVAASSSSSFSSSSSAIFSVCLPPPDTPLPLPRVYMYSNGLLCVYAVLYTCCSVCAAAVCYSSNRRREGGRHCSKELSGEEGEIVAHQFADWSKKHES